MMLYCIMTEINHSLEWAKVQIALDAPAHKMKRYTNDMLKMSNAIGAMVKKLSEEEINCRRQGRQTQKHAELLVQINQEIDHYEQYLTFGVLLSSGS
jgi:hypothetical protein